MSIILGLFFLQKLEEEKEVPVDDLNNPPADVPGEKIVTMVTNSVESIMKRLKDLTNFDDVDSKVRKSNLIGINSKFKKK